MLIRGSKAGHSRRFCFRSVQSYAVGCFSIVVSSRRCNRCPDVTDIPTFMDTVSHGVRWLWAECNSIRPVWTWSLGVFPWGMSTRRFQTGQECFCPGDIKGHQRLVYDRRLSWAGRIREMLLVRWVDKGVAMVRGRIHGACEAKAQNFASARCGECVVRVILDSRRLMILTVLRQPSIRRCVLTVRGSG